MKELKTYKLLFILLLIAIVVVGTFVTIKYVKIYLNEKKLKSVTQSIHEEYNNSSEAITKIDKEINGYKVIGIISIDKIDLEYPILEKTNKESLNLSITKFWGNDVNEIGNLTLAGHNNLNGTLFGKIKALENGDIIELTDIQNVKLKYEIFKKYVTDPNDISCILPDKEDTREITLITCTNGNKNKLIIKAREVNL